MISLSLRQINLVLISRLHSSYSSAAIVMRKVPNNLNSFALYIGNDSVGIVTSMIILSVYIL